MLLDNVDVVLAEEIAATFADVTSAMISDLAGEPVREEVGDGEPDSKPDSKRDNATRLRCQGARIMHQRWGRVTELAQVLCDRGGQLPGVPA